MTSLRWRIVFLLITVIVAPTTCTVDDDCVTDMQCSGIDETCNKQTKKCVNDQGTVDHMCDFDVGLIEDFLNWKIPHKDCDMFYQCASGKIYLKECPPNTYFSKRFHLCVDRHTAACDKDPTERLLCAHNPCGDKSTCTELEGNDFYCTCNSTPAGTPCNTAMHARCTVSPGATHKLWKIAHPHFCDRYYQCNNGVAYLRFCGYNYLYNSRYGLCDAPENVDCDKNGVREKPMCYPNNPCKNDGYCKEKSGDNFECFCTEGFSGTDCSDVVTG